MNENQVTSFINIDSEDFIGYYNSSIEPNGYTIKTGETRQFTKGMAELFASQLVDKMLQKEPYNLHDTKRDTPVRRSLFAKIIPEITSILPEVKKLSTEEEMANVKKELERTNALVKSIVGSKKEEDSKDKEIAELKEMVNKLMEKKGGRPKKVKEPIIEKSV